MTQMIGLSAAYSRLDGRARDWLRGHGVSAKATLLWPGPIGVAEIELHDLGIFDFAETGRQAFVHPVWSGDFGSEIIDVLAWMPANPSRWWTLNYTGWALGADQLDYAEFWSEPVLLHPTPLAWLAAGGVGAVILDWIMSSTQLRAIPQIIVDDPEFGREVQRRLTLPVQTCPEIRVRIGQVAA